MLRVLIVINFFFFRRSWGLQVKNISEWGGQHQRFNVGEVRILFKKNHLNKVLNALVIIFFFQSSFKEGKKKHIEAPHIIFSEKDNISVSQMIIMEPDISPTLCLFNSLITQLGKALIKAASLQLFPKSSWIYPMLNDIRAQQCPFHACYLLTMTPTRKFPQRSSEIWQSPAAIIDWQRILVVPRTEMKCKCLFLAVPSLFQNVQKGFCFNFENYFQQIPFPISSQAFPEVVFVLSKVFLFHPKSGALTFWNQWNKKMQCVVHGNCYDCQTCSYFLICREDDCYCWENQNIC